MMTNGKETLQTAERRVAPRRQPAFGTVCRFTSEEKPRTGLVWNLSTSGVSMLLHEPCPAGAHIEGELRTIDEAVALPITVRVAHVRRLETGDYLVGGPFRRPLSSDEMGSFVDTRRGKVGG